MKANTVKQSRIMSNISELCHTKNCFIVFKGILRTPYSCFVTVVSGYVFL